MKILSLYINIRRSRCRCIVILCVLSSLGTVRPVHNKPEFVHIKFDKIKNTKQNIQWDEHLAPCECIKHKTSKTLNERSPFKVTEVVCSHQTCRHKFTIPQRTAIACDKRNDYFFFSSKFLFGPKKNVCAQWMRCIFVGKQSNFSHFMILNIRLWSFRVLCILSPELAVYARSNVFARFVHVLWMSFCSVHTVDVIQMNGTLERAQMVNLGSLIWVRLFIQCACEKHDTKKNGQIAYEFSASIFTTSFYVFKNTIGSWKRRLAYLLLFRRATILLNRINWMRFIFKLDQQ